MAVDRSPWSCEIISKLDSLTCRFWLSAQQHHCENDVFKLQNDSCS
uniref:Uncharacterized protein n=1 Tax=Arundo donax TaxID=35708 RepID=A0A0A9NZU7_ARUDO